MKRIAVLIAAFACIVLAAGCERAMHDMYRQPHYKPMAPSTLWPDGTSSRPAVPGSVVANAGAFAMSSSGRVGAAGAGAADAAAATPLTRALLERGHERFTIYCAPCHGAVGDGDGIVPRRGFPHPPSFHSDALRQAPDAHFTDVIANGYGAMIPYGDRVAPVDRRAIVSWIRALQLSQHAPMEAVPDRERATLEAAR